MIYQLMPEDIKMIKKTRVYCLYVFMPMFVSIPFFVGTGLVPMMVPAHKLANVFVILNLLETFSVIMGLTCYNILNKLVTSIVYNVDDNTFTIKWLGSWMICEME